MARLRAGGVEGTAGVAPAAGGVEGTAGVRRSCCRLSRSAREVDGTGIGGDGDAPVTAENGVYEP